METFVEPTYPIIRREMYDEDYMETFVEPTYPIVRREMFDEDNMKHLLVDDRYSQADRKRMSLYYKKKRNAGEAQVVYTLASGCEANSLGRLFAQNSLGIANWAWTMRNPLAQKWYWDIDIANSHYRIALEFCKRYEIPYEKIAHYCDNRQAVLSMVCPESRDRAKMEFLKVLYGGDIKLYSCYANIGDGIISKEGFAYLKGMVAEIALLADTIWTNYPQYHNLKTGADYEDKKSVRISKKPNPKASLMSLIFQTEERKMLMLIAEHFRLNGRYMGVFIHDGGYVEKISDETEFPKDLLVEASQEIERHLGYKVTLIQKPITHNWEPKNPLKNTVNLFDEWEKTHSKIVDTGMYVEEVVRDGQSTIIVRGEKRLQECFRHLTITEQKVDKNFETKDVKVSFIDKWTTTDTIRQYTHMGVYPPPLKCPETVFNIWRPFEASRLIFEDAPEELEMFKKLMYHLGGKDEKVALYLIQWLAQSLQYPAEKTGIIPNLISHQGAGKGAFFDTISALTGAGRFISTAEPKDIFDNFNVPMECAFFINLNEMNAKQMKAFEGHLKHLATEPYMRIVRKGSDPYQIKSFHRFITTTNDEFGCVVMKTDDRRNFIVRASDDLIPDLQFFIDYRTKILNSSAGLSTIYNYLMNIKGMDKFREIKKPRTNYEEELLLLNRSPYEAWVEEYTNRNRETTETRFKSKDLFDDFLKFTEAKDNHKFTPGSFGMRIMNVVLGGITRGGQVKSRGMVYETKEFNWALLRKRYPYKEIECIDDLAYNTDEEDECDTINTVHSKLISGVE